MDTRTRGGRLQFAVIALVLAVTLDAQASQTLTLDQAITEALHNNLQLMAERLELPVADAELIAARLRPNPTITYSTDNFSAERLFGSRPADTKDRTIELDVPIVTGGKRQLRIENAGLTRRIAGLHLQDAVRRLRLDVATAYSEAWRALQRAQLAHSNADLLNDVVRVNAVRVKSGALSQLELTRSATAMYLVRSDAARADVDVTATALRLTNTLGRRATSGAIDLAANDSIDLPPAPAALDVAEAEALRSRPDLVAARLTVEQRDAALRLAVAQSRIDPVAGFSYTRKDLAGTTSQVGASYGLHVSLPLPVFDRNQGDIARATAEKAAAEAQVKALEEEVRTEVRTAFAQYRASKQILEDIRADLLPAAKKSRDTATYVYRTHASSLLEFLDAERAWNDTMQSYFDAQAAVIGAAFQLEAATGGSHANVH